MLVAQTIRVTFPHTDPRSIWGKKEVTTCEEPLEVAVEFEPPEPNHGADADGNRGVYVPGYHYTEDLPSNKCAACGHVWTPEERKAIDIVAIETAQQDDDEDDDLIDLDDDEDDDDLDDDDFDDDDLDDEDDDLWSEDDEDDHQELLEERV